MRKRRAEHPALALMRHEARGYLTRFITDLETHDAAALAKHAPHEAFGWVLHPGATWLTFTSSDHRPHRFAATFIGAYGPDDCRFFFWDGSVFTTYRCAWALDERIAEHEESLRESARAGELADRGVA